jgi:hypothetical protein
MTDSLFLDLPCGRALQIVAETDDAVEAPHGMYPAGHDPNGTDGLYIYSE